MEIMIIYGTPVAMSMSHLQATLIASNGAGREEAYIVQV
jgi:hypothetical protein